MVTGVLAPTAFGGVERGIRRALYGGDCTILGWLKVFDVPVAFLKHNLGLKVRCVADGGDRRLS